MEKHDDPLAFGWDLYRFGEFDAAVETFRGALETPAPGDPRRADALFGLATTWNLRTPMVDQDKARAAELYKQTIAADPGSDLAAWSLLALARMQHLVPVGEEPDYDAVRAAYRRVIEAFPEHLAGHEAFIYLQATRVQTLEAEPTRQAAEALERFIAEHPDSGFVSGAWQLLAACYETLGNPERQLEAEIRALETMEADPANPKHENSGRYWRIATIAEFEAGNFELARRYYRRLIEEYPQDIRVYASEQALERMRGVEARLRGGADGAPASGEEPSA